MRLLLDAFCLETSALDGSKTTAEAEWSCSQEVDACLQLRVRFLYPAGPVVAVQNVQLAPFDDVSAAFSRFFDVALKAQGRAASSRSSAELECQNQKMKGEHNDAHHIDRSKGWQ